MLRDVQKTAHISSRRRGASSKSPRGLRGTLYGGTGCSGYDPGRPHSPVVIRWSNAVVTRREFRTFRNIRRELLKRS